MLQLTQKKTRLITIAAGILLIVLLIGICIKKISTHRNEYSIVYLTTGEVYVGKLSYFPNLRLKDGYILLVTKDPNDANKNNFQLNPLKDALWAPKILYLTDKNVVFYGPLSPDSKIAQTIAGGGK